MKIRIDQREQMVSMDFRTFTVLSMLGRMLHFHLEADSDVSVAVGAILGWAADEQDHISNSPLTNVQAGEEMQSAEVRFCMTMMDIGKAIGPGLVEIDQDFARTIVGVSKFLHENMPMIGGMIDD